MTILHIDFETSSACELKDAGLDNYASHPSTGVHCMAYCFDDGPVELMPIPAMDPIVFSHVVRGGLVYAHNAAFELAIWNKVCVPRYGWPILSPMQMRCTMAMAYAMALPGGLDKASAALGIDQQKDMVGARVMMQLAKPKADGTLWKPEDAPEKFQRLYDYCKQDVVVERELHKRMMELSESEQLIWQIDQRINQRGIHVDLRSIDAAIQLVEAEKARLDAQMLRVTGGVVGKCTEVQLLVKWIKSEGVEIKGVAKADLLDALAGDLPDRVRQALALRKEAAKSSTAKLIAMKSRASKDGRVRGCFQFHGAATGRWAHRGIQPGNLPRPRPSTKQRHIEDIITNLDLRDYIDIQYGPVLDAMADCIRGMITAGPGHELVAMDFSAIEARALAWLAGQESVLDIFRTHGMIYEHAAAGIYGVHIDAVTKDQRQIGKVAVLALGYGGGVGAFQSMARVYGVKVPDEQADQIKKAWREAHPKIVQYWYDLETAAINAVEFGLTTKAGAKGREVTFRKAGSFLWCRLPSGRVLCYPYPVIREVEVPWGGTKPALHYMAVNGVTNKWEETSTYGGSLCENVTQAVAACLLRDALVSLEDEGYPVVMHVHDEVVVEIPACAGPETEKEIENIMATVPQWADGLPLAAEGWRGFRYRK